MSVDVVYVHAPFCVRRCFYCDFAVEVRREGGVDPWVGAIEAELEALMTREPGILAPALRTLYVGGGTPSVLGPTAMARLAGVLGRERLAAPGLEWTAEANPESLTTELVEGWRSAGVNRLSLGIQSFQEPALKWMGRLHGAEGARTAIETARAGGVDNLSVDLIFGLPRELDRDWSADLDAVVELDVPHVSLYGLTAEPATPLGRSVTAGKTVMPHEERYREEYLLAHERLVAAGFTHYEVSNFARPGFESRHNGAYWDGSAYLGLGNSAHSYLPPTRRWNLRDWGDYLQKAQGGSLPIQEEEVVEGEAALLERLWLGLRTRRGLAPQLLDTGDGGRLVQEWIHQGLARKDDGRVVLTPEGWLLLDELAVDLSRIVTAG